MTAEFSSIHDTSPKLFVHAASVGSGLFVKSRTRTEICAKLLRQLENGVAQGSYKNLVARAITCLGRVLSLRQR